MDALLRTGRTAIVLGYVLGNSDADDPLTRLVASFLVPVLAWDSAMDRDGLDEAEALARVQWLYANNVPEIETYYHRPQDNRQTPMDNAATRGFLSVVHFLHAQPSTLGRARSTIKRAARHGHAAIVQFLYAHCADDHAAVRKAMVWAARRGHLDIVQYLYETAPRPMDIRVWMAAAQSGQLAVLEFFHAQLPPRAIAAYDRPPVDAMDAAVVGNHVAVVAWLHEHVPDARACTQRAFHYAISNEAHATVRFVLEAQYPDLDFVDAMDHAAGTKDIEMLRLFHETSLVGCTSKAMDTAAANGPLEMVEFLHTNRTEGCTADAMDQAAANGHLEIVQYLHTNRSEGFTLVALSSATSNGHLAIVQYLCEACGVSSTIVATAAVAKCIAARRLDLQEA